MERLNNSQLLIYNDNNYIHAINYRQHLYNSPITLNYGEKHNRAKYINTETREEENNVFLNESDCTNEDNFTTKDII